MGAGAAYGLLVGARASKLWYGVPFGALVRAGGYVRPLQPSPLTPKHKKARKELA